MRHKKALSVLLLGAALSITATSVFASDYSTPTTVSSESITFKENLVISDKGISQSGGTYERSWNQPAGWSYYRFNVNNTTSTKVTITISEHGRSNSYSLAANSQDTWVRAGVPAGDHTITVSTSDGRRFTGDVAVRISDVPF
ncbi:hypothetical protein [Paenibacillus lautus]|uniref:hypothetical protein n=1 Tax=Paenibacillus lautus TaxID=1401 RepID=UPI003D295A4D